jgi:glycine cleavage system transcriptional repressor
MSQIVIITAIGGRDKPGIVAALAEAIYEAGGNLDDATMTRLHGAFATMIAAKLPTASARALLANTLRETAARMDLHVTLEDIPDAHQELPPDHHITVYGADRRGIVTHISRLLAGAGINITDLNTRVAGGPENPVYVMMLETAGGDWEGLAERLSLTGTELGVEVLAKELETETL